MAPWMLALALGSRRTQVTQTFTANATWTAPVTTSQIDTAVGKGAAGTPGTPGRTGWQMITTTTYNRRDGGIDQSNSVGPGVFDGSPKPSNYCDSTVSTPDNAIYTSYYVCYLFGTVTQSGSSGTTGAAATGFGKTFPGGTGGAATLTTYTNVAVTRGASYNLVVPAGGSITITYFQ